MVAIGIIIDVPIMLLDVHVIDDVAGLYSVTFIEQLTYSALFGAILIYKIFRVFPTRDAVKKAIMKEEQEDWQDVITIGLTQAFTHALIIVVMWMTAYLMHWMVIG